MSAPAVKQDADQEESSTPSYTGTSTSIVKQDHDDKANAEPIRAAASTPTAKQDADQAPSSTPAQPPHQPTHELAKHSAFSPRAKAIIVVSASIAALFSPLTSNIYYPALNSIAHDLHVTSTLVNLSITTYLIFQALAPTFIGGFSDNAGRRPAYIISFIIFLAANLGLALQDSYAALMVLRCLQSSGSSGTVALTYAVVADVATSAERGKYIAFASVGQILGPALSPVIGGLLSHFLGWRWIFWFLLIFSGAYLVPFLLFFPETGRKIVGDGSIPPPALNHSLWTLWREKKRVRAGLPVDFAKRDELASTRRIRFPNPLATLVIVFDKEAALILISMGMLYACFLSITASIPSQFGEIYGFNQLQISLVYLPLGGGSVVSAFTTGRIIDWNYRRHAQRIGFPIIKDRQQDLTNFPIELARIEIGLILLYMGALCMIGYGWTVQYHRNLAAPVIFIFFAGYSLIAGFTSISALMIDIYPGKPATATAANNLVRCLLGAAATAVVLPMIRAMGLGWTCTTMAMLWASSSPTLLWIVKVGPRWRREKKDKKEAKEAKRSAVDAEKGSSQHDEHGSRHNTPHENASQDGETEANSIAEKTADEAAPGTEHVTTKT